MCASRAGLRAACGLAAVIAAASAVLAGEMPAGAAIASEPRHVPRSIIITRYIRYDGHIANIRGRRESAPGKAAKRARPWTITVPSIGVAAGLMPLGGPAAPAGADGLALPVPPLAKAATEAGWYHFTPVPGAAGNAVIVGHVDTYVGPGVFYNLYALRRGDPVYVHAGGTRQRFDVTSVRELPKPSFPVNQVFGTTERHMLWLITCGGPFDYETGHYTENIVVSAIWVPVAAKIAGPREKTSAKRPPGHLKAARRPR